MQSAPIDLAAAATGATGMQAPRPGGAENSGSFTLLLAGAVQSGPLDAKSGVSLLPPGTAPAADLPSTLTVLAPSLLHQAGLSTGNALPANGNGLPQQTLAIPDGGVDLAASVPANAIAQIAPTSEPLVSTGDDSAGFQLDPAPDGTVMATGASPELAAEPGAETTDAGLGLAALPLPLPDPTIKPVASGRQAVRQPVDGPAAQLASTVDGEIPPTQASAAPVRPVTGAETVARAGDDPEHVKAPVIEQSADAIALVRPAAAVTPAAASPQAGASQVTLTEPVGSTGWQNAMGRQLVRMVDGGLRQVEIRLDPPDLGPIDIHLQVRDDKATVAFQAQHGLTRDALETALPRLREMLAEQGIVLQQANVSDQSAGGDRQRAAMLADHAGPKSGTDDPTDAEPAQTVRRQVGLVDLYA